MFPCAHCSEVVPEQLRSTVYAFDRSFEGAVGATAAPLVGAPGSSLLHPAFDLPVLQVLSLNFGLLPLSMLARH